MKTMKIIAAVVIIGLGMQASTGLANASSTAPITNHGMKWRIGYYEGGPYINYPVNLRTIVAGLVELGWMAPVTIPRVEDETLSEPVWDYIAQHAKSNYIEFVPDGYWCAEWDSKKRVEIKEAIIHRLNENKDIDFMIAMGTWWRSLARSWPAQVPMAIMKSISLFSLSRWMIASLISTRFSESHSAHQYPSGTNSMYVLFACFAR